MILIRFIFLAVSATQPRLLKRDQDYFVHKLGAAFKIMFKETHYLIDLYSESLWPERFTDTEMEKRRKECRTLNEWDSQYQMHAKPVGEVRLIQIR